MAIIIYIHEDNMGPAATREEAELYCAWADDWFAREYPELDVEHRIGVGNGRTPEEVSDAADACWAAWCEQD